MGTPFLGEIKIVSFGFAPKGWAQCNGQLMPINQNQALFSLLGTMYGGNGQTTFALPDLRGRVPIHFGDGHIQGESAGQEAATITSQSMPAHNHLVMTSAAQTPGSSTPNGNFLGRGNNVYRGGSGTTTLSPSTITGIGGGQPHENMQPSLTLSFCIALVGIFPSRN